MDREEGTPALSKLLKAPKHERGLSEAKRTGVYIRDCVCMNVTVTFYDMASTSLSQVVHSAPAIATHQPLAQRTAGYLSFGPIEQILCFL